MFRRRRARVGSRTIRLNALQAEVLAVLLILRGRVVPVGDIVSYAWEPDDEPEWSEALVRIAIQKLRRKGVPIISDYGHGYMIARLCKGT